MSQATSQYQFIADEWPEIFDSAQKVEQTALGDPRTACFYARRSIELMVRWIYDIEKHLYRPEKNTLAALIYATDFRRLIGKERQRRLTLIKDFGNDAAHSTKPITQSTAIVIAGELFHSLRWFASSYGLKNKPKPGLSFQRDQLPQPNLLAVQTQEQLQAIAKELQQRDEELSRQRQENQAFQEQLEALRKELEALRKARGNKEFEDLTEAEARLLYIDHDLAEAGWKLNQGFTIEVLVQGMPNQTGEGYVDYVLWGDDGNPLAIVEAKRTSKDPQEGQRQAELYANCLEQKYGQRPIIFLSNGLSHRIWDDRRYPPRPVQGFYKKAELDLLIRRRQSLQPLHQAPINSAIAGRFYQEHAIRAISETFSAKHRKALVVMATGSGKTRTVIALSELLIRCNWVKRVLFLADRTALVNQAEKAFKAHLADCATVNLCTNPNGEGRIFLSTYPTMLNRIDEIGIDGKRRFGVGHFDLIIIDEAHRSIYQKYSAIFEYFDSLLVGLTATPRQEIDRNTYSLFDLETGMPTDEYGLDQAIQDRYLVPFRPLSVPLQFQREGIRYDQLSEDEKEEWDNLDWGDDSQTPDRVEAAQVNQWLFNADTVDKVLQHLMTQGTRAADSDRIGKTIIFAKNHRHAEFIQERFDLNYPHLQGKTARVIDNQIPYAQSLIEEFSDPDKPLDIAISVDMLDTGIDVPEVVNLVFFKLVRSKTKFWQMVGRGTRLCPKLFGPGQDKQFFWIFDYCQNLEYFLGEIAKERGKPSETLSTKLFRSRLALIQALDRSLPSEAIGIQDDQTDLPSDEAGYRAQLAGQLRQTIQAMNPDNFLVKPYRHAVKQWSESDRWRKLDETAGTLLADQLATLPSQLPSDDQAACQFDLLLYKLQIALLKQAADYPKLRSRVQTVAQLLEGRCAIPMVGAELSLIQDLQTQEWWEDVTLPLLEKVRRTLRGLVGLIEKTARQPLYTNFEDQIGKAKEIDASALITSDDFTRFRLQAKKFLLEHDSHLAIQRLRRNQPLTPTDLEELEAFLLSNKIGSQSAIDRAKQESQGFGRFVRSLVGLDRNAAKEAFSEFLSDRLYGAAQIQFVNEIINYLTTHGVMDKKLLYEQPFTNHCPAGPEDLFEHDSIAQLCNIIDLVSTRAETAV